MAKIQGTGLGGFNSFNLNLDDVFAGRTTTVATPNGPLTQDGMRVVVGATVFDLPSHDLGVTTRVDLTSDRDVAQALMGRDFVFGAKGELLSGTISLLWGPSDSPLGGVSVLGLSLDVADFLAVAQTRTNRDDAQMMRQAFAGNDLVDGTFESDVYAIGAGKDRVLAGFGDDKVFGGRGDDWAEGDFGNDTLYGGSGYDLLIGNDGSDQLFGGSGNDTLSGKGLGFEGADTLTGEWGRPVRVPI